MKKFLIGLVVGVLLLPVCAYFYVRAGYAPVATAAAPFPLERKLAQMALHARISREAPAKAAIDTSEANLIEGAKVYREHCAVCHGTKGQPKTAIAKGMYPSPPQLFEGMGVLDDPPGETYWKVANGIRLTGMPAFGGSLDATRMWQVSMMLAHADHLPASVNTLLESGPAAR
jgi:thiosulfate dehydrogenase